MKHVNARALVANALAEVLRPPEAATLSEWASRNLVVPDGPRAGRLFDASLAPYLVEPLDMLGELREDNKALATGLREAHDVCYGHEDIASASLIENWIDETERRTWFLFEASRSATQSGH